MPQRMLASYNKRKVQGVLDVSIHNMVVVPFQLTTKRLRTDVLSNRPALGGGLLAHPAP